MSACKDSPPSLQPRRTCLPRRKQSLAFKAPTFTRCVFHPTIGWCQRRRLFAHRHASVRVAGGCGAGGWGGRGGGCRVACCRRVARSTFAAAKLTHPPDEARACGCQCCQRHCRRW